MNDLDQSKGKLDFSPEIRSARLRGRSSVETGKDQKSKKSMPPPQKKRSRRRKKRYLWLRLFNWKWFMLVGTTSSLLMFGFITSLLFVAKFQHLEKINNIKTQSVVIARDDQLGAKQKKIYYEFIPIQEIRAKNPLLLDTFVRVEDVRFYRHNGVDFKALFRATAKTLLGDKQGGGTITMQVARNVIIESHKQTLSRKLNEMAVAWNLNREYSKSRILEAYVNGIDFGNQIKGAQLAAKAYFGKDLRKDILNPNEVAVLVAIINGPSVYDPYGSKDTQENLKERRDLILAMMSKEDDGMKALITPIEKESWQQKPMLIKSKLFKDRVLGKIGKKE
ncbi:biosynthetic peptidoglycan transglycosylase [Thermoflavimicrobium daqui]|uniref:Glycosyl transferase family 51 domain-containing protein n=1 Tax=Thermoflavimicrobium daqui TaxID=2137476 RepID=A0A364K1L6_9BACL|nr:biosynthetic peptidoglycan transglycosylase [Thermoflavimicrobium daqui]RAL21845.1 hypothetical protein DL897_15625 [Thermoflavimicrobium daqui]